MARQRELVLHVGTHKTGTSSIQQMMAAQRDDPRASGIDPYIERTTGNAYRLAHAVIRPDLPTPMRLRNKNSADPAAIDRFANWCDHLETPKALVSSEAFCFLRTEAERSDLATLLSRWFSAIRVIVAFRDRAGWSQSWSRQIERMGLSDKVAHLPGPRRITADWYFDITAIRKFWAGVGDLTILDYDFEIMTRGTILPGFTEAAGLQGFAFRQDYRKNVS